MATDQFGQIIRRTPRIIPIERNPEISATPVSNTNLGLWSTFDSIVGGIGNWIADSSETIVGILTIIFGIVALIPIIKWFVSIGLFWSIVAGIFLGGIIYYAFMIVVGIFAFVCYIAIGVIRFVFLNGLTFLITIAIAVGLLWYNGSMA